MKPMLPTVGRMSCRPNDDRIWEKESTEERAGARTDDWWAVRQVHRVVGVSTSGVQLYDSR